MQKKTKIKLGVAIALGAVAASVAATAGGIVATQQKTTTQKTSNSNAGPIYVIPNDNKLSSFQDGFNTTTTSVLNSRKDFEKLTGFSVTQQQFAQLKHDVLNSKQYKSVLTPGTHAVQHVAQTVSPKITLSSQSQVPQGIIKLLKQWSVDFNTFGTDINSAIAKLKGITTALQNVMYYAGWLLPSSTKASVETLTKVAEWAGSISQQVLAPLANFSLKISNILNNWSSSKVLNEIQDVVNGINTKINTFFSEINTWFQGVLQKHPIIRQAWDFIDTHIISPIKDFFEVSLKNWFNKVYNDVKYFIIVEDIREKVSQLQAPSSISSLTAQQAIDASNKSNTETQVMNLIKNALAKNLSVNSYLANLSIYNLVAQNNDVYVYLALNGVHAFNPVVVTGFKAAPAPAPAPTKQNPQTQPTKTTPTKQNPQTQPTKTTPNTVPTNTNVIQFNLNELKKATSSLNAANTAINSISAPSGYSGTYGFQELLSYKTAFSAYNTKITAQIQQMTQALEAFQNLTSPTETQKQALVTDINNFNVFITQEQKTLEILLNEQTSYVKDNLSTAKIWWHYLWSASRRGALEKDVSLFNTYANNLNSLINLSLVLNHNI